MKLCIFLLVLWTSSNILAQTALPPEFGGVSELFIQGKYESTIEELNQIEKTLSENKKMTPKLKGLIHYWKGMSANRLQEYGLAIESFAEALKLSFTPQDIHYEAGQALMAGERLEDARLQFVQSLRRNFKKNISLYYLAYISQELGEYKKAVNYYKAIRRLPPEEAKEVQQAAEVQIGDIYLILAEKSRKSITNIKTFVIPQYESALAMDEKSPLSGRIREKILDVKRRHELVLFKLRNGRIALDPPYFLRAAIEAGVDSNVTFAPTETTVAEAKQSSSFMRTDLLGRYTFYHQDVASVSPEFRTNMTYYFNREPEVYRNDNMLFAPAVRSAYEYELWGKPASHLLDYEFAYALRDVDAQEQMEFSSHSHNFMIGERFNYFTLGETIVRLRRRLFDSFNDDTDSETSSISLEQIAGVKSNTLLFYLGYDQTRVTDSTFDTNAYSARIDLILARWGDFFTPSIGLALTSIDPINNSERGRELLTNPSLWLSRMFYNQFRVNLRYDYQDYDSKDKERFAYEKSIYSLELEYLF